MPVLHGLYSAGDPVAGAAQRPAIIRSEMSDAGAGEAQLREQDLRGDWLEQLCAWLDEARAAGK